MQPTLFDGPSILPTDTVRLSRQLGRVKALMMDMDWHTLAEIAEKCGGSESGCSARLRDLRKSRFGGYVIERKRVAAGNGELSGLWMYRMEIPT